MLSRSRPHAVRAGPALVRKNDYRNRLGEFLAKNVLRPGYNGGARSGVILDSGKYVGVSVASFRAGFLRCSRKDSRGRAVKALAYIAGGQKLSRKPNRTWRSSIPSRAKLFTVLIA